MTPEENDEPIFAHAINTSLIVQCPHCSRTEEFDDDSTANAWLVGHIQEEHADELPSYDGTGDEGGDE